MRATDDSGNRYPVPVVRIVVQDAQGRVLLLRRVEGSHSGGSWCLPGGKVDYGDTVEETVIKELAEETSLSCASPRFLFYQDSPPTEPGDMHCVNLYFACDATGEPSLNEESSAFAWVGGPAELAGYSVAFHNDEGLLRFWRERG